MFLLPCRPLMSLLPLLLPLALVDEITSDRSVWGAGGLEWGGGRRKTTETHSAERRPNETPADRCECYPLF